MPDGTKICSMFAAVADRYDRANHVLSLGIDHLWRRAAVRFAEIQPGERVLDACAGTGDLSLALARAGAEVVASDFCAPMLVQTPGKAEAQRRARPDAGLGRLDCVVADTLHLPFPDDSFDVATVAFGIRNVADPVAGLRELRRVVRPGGRVLVLEFTTPRVPVLRQGYLFYFRRVLPKLGAWISGTRDGAYDYLQNSVMQFPEYGAFRALMEEAGLESPRQRVLTFGIATLYRGEVAQADGGIETQRSAAEAGQAAGASSALAASGS
jgi:demethylmenaquinone methyltransferase/2-methoxy-6-polyprenyl-1,4-benzoquinol methylase